MSNRGRLQQGYHSIATGIPGNVARWVIVAGILAGCRESPIVQPEMDFGMIRDLNLPDLAEKALDPVGALCRLPYTCASFYCSSEGQCSSSKFQEVRFLASEVPQTIAVADFDSDKKPDIVVANYSTEPGGVGVTFFWNVGQAAFQPAKISRNRSRPVATYRLAQAA